MRDPRRRHVGVYVQLPVREGSVFEKKRRGFALLLSVGGLVNVSIDTAKSLGYNMT